MYKNSIIQHIKKVVIAFTMLFIFAITAYAAFTNNIDTVVREELYGQIPNDTTAPKIASEYTKNSINDSEKARQWAIDNTNIDVVWNVFSNDLSVSSEDIFVVVLERWVDLTHTDLRDNMYVLSEDVVNGNVIGRAYQWDGEPGSPSEWDITPRNWKKSGGTSVSTSYSTYFHGTHIAGIIGAKHNNLGIAGIDPKVHIIPVSDNNVEVNLTTWISDTLYPLLQAKTGETPKIIVQYATAGVGIPINNPLIQSQMAELKRMTDEKGILFISSAGNNHKDYGNGTYTDNEGNLNMYYPTTAGVSCDNFISVANHDSNGNLGEWSNYSTSGDQAAVHISAPGTKIISTGRGVDSNDAQVNEYWVASGTSMASPHVSGAAALLWRLFPDATVAEIKQLLLAGANMHHNDTCAPHDGKLATTIGGYVKTGYLDVAASVKQSKSILGAARGRDIAIPLKNIPLAASTTSFVGGNSSVISVGKLTPSLADNKTFTMSLDVTPTVATITASGDQYVLNTNPVSTTTTVHVSAIPNDGLGGSSNVLTFTLSPAVLPIPVTGVKMSNAVSGVEYANNTNITIYTGNSNRITLQPIVVPSDANCIDSDFNWTYNDSLVAPACASIVKTGRNIQITGVSEGTFTAKVTINGFSTSVNITVTNVPYITSVSLNKTAMELEPRDTEQLTATVSPIGINNNVTWQSSNPGVATVNENGLITAISKGQTVIMVTTEGVKADGTRATAQCTVIVTNTPAPTPDPTPAPVSGGGGGGGCNAGFSLLTLLTILPCIYKKKTNR